MMGKQINYYMGYSDFLNIARQAIDCGCKVLKKETVKIIFADTTDIVTETVNSYYFYLPQAGKLSIRTINSEEYIGGYNSSGNVIIEAGYSQINCKDKKITRARLFIINGYYDIDGKWIERPDCLTKTYNKLVRTVKKTAPYTEMTDIYISTANDYLQDQEWKHKEYITEELLKIKLEGNYKLAL